MGGAGGGGGWQHGTRNHIYIPGTRLSSILVVVCPPKQGPNSNQNKGPHLGSRYISRPENVSEYESPKICRCLS